MKLADIRNFVLGILFLFQMAYAGTTGKIVGTVTDAESGEPLVGVNIVLEGTSLGSSTDPDGYFSIINVPPGTYRMSVFYIGYATTTVENLSVSIDRTTTQNVDMQSEVLTGQTVIVEAERPAIETTTPL